MMQPRIMLTGVPGVGKTTVARHPRVGQFMLRVVTFGEVMTRIGITKNIISRGDELRTIELSKRSALQTEAAELIVDDSRTSPVLIDGHLLVDTPAGLVPGLPFKCVSLLNLNAIILLRAPPRDIAARRQKNESRYRMMREWSNEERIQFHERLLLETSLQYALLSGASLECLDNLQDKLDETIDGFINAIMAIAPTLDIVPDP